VAKAFRNFVFKARRRLRQLDTSKDWQISIKQMTIHIVTAAPRLLAI